MFFDLHSKAEECKPCWLAGIFSLLVARTQSELSRGLRVEGIHLNFSWACYYLHDKSHAKLCPANFFFVWICSIPNRFNFAIPNFFIILKSDILLLLWGSDRHFVHSSLCPGISESFSYESTSFQSSHVALSPTAKLYHATKTGWRR